MDLEGSASELKLPQIKPSALSQTLESTPQTHRNVRASIDMGKQGVRNNKHETALPHKVGYMDLIQAMVQPPPSKHNHANLKTITHAELPTSLVSVSLLNQTDP